MKYSFLFVLLINKKKKTMKILFYSWIYKLWNYCHLFWTILYTSTIDISKYRANRDNSFKDISMFIRQNFFLFNLSSFFFFFLSTPGFAYYFLMELRVTSHYSYIPKDRYREWKERLERNVVSDIDVNKKCQVCDTSMFSTYNDNNDGRCVLKITR